MTTLAEKMRILLKDAHLTETELSRQTQIGQPVIHRIVSGATTNPKIQTLQPLASFFSVTIDELINNKPLTAPFSARASSFIKHIPFIPFKRLSHWLNPQEMYDTKQTVVIDTLCGDDAFATELIDSSMRPTLPEGSLVIVDPQHSALDRDLILVYRKQKNRCLIKQLLIDGEEQLLKPHNEDFSIQPVHSSDIIVGPIIQARMSTKIV